MPSRSGREWRQSCPSHRAHWSSCRADELADVLKELEVTEVSAVSGGVEAASEDAREPQKSGKSGYSGSLVFVELLEDVHFPPLPYSGGITISNML